MLAKMPFGSAALSDRKLFGPATFYLAAIAGAETVTAQGSPMTGLILHVLVLLALVIHASFAAAYAPQRLYLALALAPLIRILSLALPLYGIPLVFWYGLVAVPLLIATFTAMRLLGYSREDVGLISDRLPRQLLVGLIGVPLGVVEYLILKPQPLAGSLSLEALWLPVLTIVVGTGLTEELIFRGVLQRVALESMPRRGILYVSALFALLHLGYNSVIELVFVFVVGWLFALVVARTGSILGVTLAHGLLNTTLFLIAPLLILALAGYGTPQTPARAAAGISTAVVTPADAARPVETTVPVAAAPAPVALAPEGGEPPEAAVPTPPPAATPVGETTAPALVVVSGTGGKALRLRHEPGLSGTIITEWPEGSVLERTGDEVRADGYVWWKVRDTRGSLGWVAANSVSPPAQARSATKPTPVATPAAAPSPGWTTHYTVQRGDTLFAIAARFGTTVDALIALNGLPDRSHIAAGQRLSVPDRPVAVHVVARGETLTAIALRYGTTVAKIVALNGIGDRNALVPGQRLLVPLEAQHR